MDRAIEAAGLGDIPAARREGRLDAAGIARLRAADLLALGALADHVRSEEVGAEVRIYTADPPVDDEVIELPAAGAELTGLELLREVAVARVSGPRQARVRVDWTRAGLELAQVALGFGANELRGLVASKRGLPISEGELLGIGKKSRRELAQRVKRKELAAFVQRAGRTPSFIGPDGAPETVSGSAPIDEAT